MRYLVVLERARSGYRAHSPDVPGCVATGKTRALVLRRMGAALALHLEGLQEDGLPFPVPSADALFLEITSG
ncbi:MAG: type II toxin-antitoxin system HicB family antitoxin [Planctomycetes bacterium]|nr:type II toxin-antitoxin system HicB family antitoxin [Planctomycetota bacterium]